MLTALGLAEDEERLYRILVTLPGPVTQAELAARAGLPAAVVAGLLGSLTTRGLVLLETQGYAVAPPAVALGALLRQQRDDLRSAETELVALAEAHRLATIGRTAGDVIEVITGTDAVRHRFAQVQHAARVEVRSMVVPNSTVVPPGENAAEPVSMARGVRYRVIVDRAFLEMPGGHQIIAEALDEGEEVRFVDKVPIKMIIADRELGMLPLLQDQNTAPASVLVQASGVLDAMIALYEEVWQRGRPVRVRPDATVAIEAGDELEEVDRQILLLLLAGLTDHAVAGSLALSARTVQRRIRHLMDLAGVTTRVQLGFHAARKDWA
ncbi:MAG: helix-turn-helix domain-containing protein [Hamadaea sp.]|uniref:helix-turn-helix domain-containing protein n=1 Tax=Hamadaea sp. TaxID=2024425 RepID=UPI001819220F|nr:helix-turn-helix domain-containing protein [Hamadaea sp.]NUR72785.1 helix-turn-helix domain-containing protein [Hamadaea sp.]NUT22716.1 helix-turn-helix domain-containing protein [Hamadaea sp.]